MSGNYESSSNDSFRRNVSSNYHFVESSFVSTSNHSHPYVTKYVFPSGFTRLRLTNLNVDFSHSMSDSFRKETVV